MTINSSDIPWGKMVHGVNKVLHDFRSNILKSHAAEKR
jgi:hypothetical protein